MRYKAVREPGRPPAAKAADTRERILVAAQRVFGEIGYDATTFQAVANRADLTRPAINHYFTNKQALYDQVVERVNTQLFIECMTTANAETSVIGRLSGLYKATTQLNADDRSAAAFLTTSLLEAQRHADLGRKEGSSLRTARAFVKWALTEAIASGELTTNADVATLVETLMAIMWGMAFYSGYIGGRDDLGTLVDTLESALANELWTFQN